MPKHDGTFCDRRQTPVAKRDSCAAQVKVPSCAYEKARLQLGSKAARTGGDRAVAALPRCPVNCLRCHAGGGRNRPDLCDLHRGTRWLRLSFCPMAPSNLTRPRKAITTGKPAPGPWRMRQFDVAIAQALPVADDSLPKAERPACLHTASIIRHPNSIRQRAARRFSPEGEPTPLIFKSLRSAEAHSLDTGVPLARLETRDS